MLIGRRASDTCIFLLIQSGCYFCTGLCPEASSVGCETEGYPGLGRIVWAADLPSSHLTDRPSGNIQFLRRNKHRRDQSGHYSHSTLVEASFLYIFPMFLGCFLKCNYKFPFFPVPEKHWLCSSDVNNFLTIPQ